MKNVIVKESRISGKEVFSNRSFKKGEVILELDDSHIVTDPATGKRIAITYIDITLFEAGKIVEEWVEYDTMNILQQIRVSESQR